MMDLENWILEHVWPRTAEPAKGLSFYFNKPHPKGRERYKDPDWERTMKSELETSDTNWEAYVEWVKDGGGDEWFHED